MGQCRLSLGQYRLQRPIATLFRVGYPTNNQWPEVDRCEEGSHKGFFFVGNEEIYGFFSAKIPMSLRHTY